MLSGSPSTSANAVVVFHTMSADASGALVNAEDDVASASRCPTWVVDRITVLS